jgi:hypothetical protein
MNLREQIRRAINTEETKKLITKIIRRIPDLDDVVRKTTEWAMVHYDSRLDDVSAKWFVETVIYNVYIDTITPIFEGWDEYNDEISFELSNKDAENILNFLAEHYYGVISERFNKRYKDNGLNEEVESDYAVIEILKPSSRMPLKWYFQAVPLHKTKEDKIYIKRGPAGTLTISTNNIKIRKIFKKSEKEEMDKYLEKLRKSQEEIKEGLHDTSWENDGDKVTLIDLLSATKDIPVENISVEELKPHLLTWGGDEEEIKKIDKADLQYPILIFVDNDGEFISIIDGHHRAQKAVKKGLETIKGKIIPINSLPKDIRKVFGHMGKLNESTTHWFRRRFSIDELDDLVKDVKNRMKVYDYSEDAIYDAIRQLIATKQFNDIDNAATDNEYWKSYMKYENPLINYVKEKLKYE